MKDLLDFERLNYKSIVCNMKNESNILEVEDLKFYFNSYNNIVKAVDGVSFEIPKGKTVAIVGESGCGKSSLALSIIKLAGHNSANVLKGMVKYNGLSSPIDIVPASLKLIEKIRGKEISMIFQEPMTTLNPVFTIGNQIEEAILQEEFPNCKKNAYKKTIDILKKVGITNPNEVYNLYPHQISGGMRQRIVIAIAISRNPKLIIADEPTTALDVTIQSQVISLLKNINKSLQTGILLITHDWGVVFEIADYVLVMYAGKIVESADIYEIYFNPKHPYTIQLLNIRKDLLESNAKLRFIPGMVPDNLNCITGCYFNSRCYLKQQKCENIYPNTVDIGGNHKVACHFLS